MSYESQLPSSLRQRLRFARLVEKTEGILKQDLTGLDLLRVLSNTYDRQPGPYDSGDGMLFCIAYLHLLNTSDYTRFYLNSRTLSFIRDIQFTLTVKEVVEEFVSTYGIEGLFCFDNDLPIYYNFYKFDDEAYGITTEQAKAIGGISLKWQLHTLRDRPNSDYMYNMIHDKITYETMISSEPSEGLDGQYIDTYSVDYGTVMSIDMIMIMFYILQHPGSVVDGTPFNVKLDRKAMKKYLNKNKTIKLM